MRTIERWKDKFLPKHLKKLTPRIQQDFEQRVGLKFPDSPVKAESMFIYGDKAFGKTIYSAFLYLQEYSRMYLEDESGECLFKSTPDLFLAIRQSFNLQAIKDVKEGYTQSSEFEIIDKYRECHLLILDDFATVKPTDWVMGVLYLIINYRYEMLKPTIITSNLSLKEVEQLFGDSRITSRIDRMCKIVKKNHWKT